MKYIISRKIGDVTFTIEASEIEIVKRQKMLEKIFGEMIITGED